MREAIPEPSPDESVSRNAQLDYFQKSRAGYTYERTTIYRGAPNQVVQADFTCQASLGPVEGQGKEQEEEEDKNEKMRIQSDTESEPTEPKRSPREVLLASAKKRNTKQLQKEEKATAKLLQQQISQEVSSYFIKN